MSLWKLIRRIISFFFGTAHAAMDELENTEIMSKQLLREIDEKVSVAREAFRDLVAQRELMESDVKTQSANLAKWEDALIRAESKPELLPEVAAKVSEAQGLYDQYKAALDELNGQVAEVEADIADLMKQRTDVANTIQVLQAQAKVAKAQTKVASATASFNIGEEKARLAEMTRKVREQQAKATATRRMARSDTGKDLMDKVNETTRPNVEELLARAKGKRAIG